MTKANCEKSCQFNTTACPHLLSACKGVVELMMMMMMIHLSESRSINAHVVDSRPHWGVVANKYFFFFFSITFKSLRMHFCYFYCSQTAKRWQFFLFLFCNPRFLFLKNTPSLLLLSFFSSRATSVEGGFNAAGPPRCAFSPKLP